MKAPVLTDQDRYSPTWQRLKAHYEARLEKLRRKNDNPMPDEDTHRLRARIDEVKLILALGNDPAKPVPVDDIPD